MSYHFSLALEAEYSRATCLDGEPSALWRSIPFASDDSCSDKMKGIFHRSPFGTMFVPSRESSGAELLTWYRAAFPAKLIPARLRGNNTADDLWPEMRRIVADVAPRYVFAENTQRRAIDRAADELESMGYTTKAISLGAHDLGADHIRKRYWLLAHADSDSELRVRVNAEVAELSRVRTRVWEAGPDESRMADGHPSRMERLEATGDGQVPIVAASAFRILSR